MQMHWRWDIAGILTAIGMLVASVVYIVNLHNEVSELRRSKANSYEIENIKEQVDRNKVSIYELNSGGETLKPESLPSKAVIAFNSRACPDGWDEFDFAKGRVIVGAGRGHGLSPRILGDTGGEERHLLTEREMPSHRHQVSPGRASSPTTGSSLPYREHPNQGPWNTEIAGGNQPHNNMPPFLVLQYCVKR